MDDKVIFAVGEKAVGSSFFGREKELEELSPIFSTMASIHLVGATRIGKSSLIRRVFELHAQDEGVLQLELCMSEYESAYHFWLDFCMSACDIIQDALDASLWEHRFKPYYEKLRALETDQANWYMRMMNPLQHVFKELKNTKYKLVVSLDEFDAVTRVFEGQSAYYQLLRSFFSDPKFAMNGVIASRRNLEVLEAKAPDISTFHGVFGSLRLQAFDGKAMEEYYSALSGYGITLSDDAKRQLNYYTGDIPYLCCLFAAKMIGTPNTEFSGQRIDELNLSLQYVIDRYYGELVERLREDDHLEALVYLAFDEMKTLSLSRKRNNMISMGYLIGRDGHYYAYTKDFMTYLRYTPIDLPTWDIMTASEKKLKRILENEFPILAEVYFQNGRARIETKIKIENNYPVLHLNWEQINKFSRTLLRFKEESSVLDVLTIGFIIDVILANWEGRFSRYFCGDDSWKSKLELIKDLRNPMAHAQEEYIGEEDLSACNRYCGEIIRMDF